MRIKPDPPKPVAPSRENIPAVLEGLVLACGRIPRPREICGKGRRFCPGLGRRGMSSLPAYADLPKPFSTDAAVGRGFTAFRKLPARPPKPQRFGMVPGRRH